MKPFQYRLYLQSVFKETLDIASAGSYTAPSGRIVTLDDDSEMIQNTRFYTHKFNVTDIPRHEEATKIEVINSDSIDAGKALIDEGYNPVVLNFANRRNAGGGVINGARAQEECLFRRTNLFRSLFQFMPCAVSFGLTKNQHQYPMHRDFGGIYTPDATVFRAADYTLLEQPYKLSFIAVAAINRPQLADNMIVPELIEPTKNKMRAILRIGLDNGHDSIVLGAFGCGAFCNPPAHIAQLFDEVINEPEFAGKYRKILFAILENHNSGQTFNPDGNLQPFIDRFGKKETI